MARVLGIGFASQTPIAATQRRGSVFAVILVSMIEPSDSRCGEGFPEYSWSVLSEAHSKPRTVVRVSPCRWIPNTPRAGRSGPNETLPSPPDVPARLVNSVHLLMKTSNHLLPCLVVASCLTVEADCQPRVRPDCVPARDPTNGQPGANADVFALKVFDDGSSPALFVGGRFNMIGGSLSPPAAIDEDEGGIAVEAVSAHDAAIGVDEHGVGEGTLVRDARDKIKIASHRICS